MGLKEDVREEIQQYKEYGDNVEAVVSKCTEYILYDIQGSKNIYLEIIEIAKQRNDELTYARIKNALGWYYHYTSDYNEAIKCRIECHEIYEKMEDTTGMMSTHNGLLSDFTMIGNYDLAIEQGLKAIELAEREKNEDILGKFIINTGCCYSQCGKFNEAKKTLDRMGVYINNLAPIDSLYYYTAIAEVECSLGNLNEAETYCEKAEALIVDEKNIIIEDEILGVRANIYSKRGLDKKAEEYYDKASKVTIKNKNISYFVKNLINWANHYTNISKYKEANEKLESALEKANEINSNILKSELYKALSNVASKIGDYEKAYRYHKIYFELEKQVFNNKSVGWFAKLNNKEAERDAEVYRELYRNIDLISSIGKKLASNLRLEKNLTLIYDEIKILIDAEIFGVALYNDKNESLSYDLFMVDGKRKDYGQVDLSEESLGGWCLRNKSNVIINNVETEVGRYITKRYEFKDNKINQSTKTEKEIQSIIFCPLIFEERVIGILTVQSYKKNAYEKSTVKKLEILSSYIAIALQNTKLFNSIEYSANHDELTGLFNRKKILKKGEEVFKSKECSILILDIDYFKSINDNYGHGNGDIALKIVADILLESITNVGFVGRYGGEEFLIVINNNDKEYIKLLSEDIRKKIEKYKFNFDGISAKITVSIGAYLLNNKNINFYDGIILADKCLYEAKNSGRNRVIFYDE